MVEIEFLDPGPDDTPADQPESGPARRAGPDRLAAAAVVVLWLGATALAAAAAFATVYRYNYRQGPQRTSTTVDAWGRYASSDGLRDTGHGPRYGIVLVACAGVLLLAALAAVPPVLGRRLPAPLRRVATAVGALGLGATAATASSLYLVVAAVRDAAAAQQRDAGRANVLAELFHIDVTTGAALWLSAAAAGCGLLALLAGPLQWLLRSRAAPPATPG